MKIMDFGFQRLLRIVSLRTKTNGFEKVHNGITMNWIHELRANNYAKYVYNNDRYIMRQKMYVSSEEQKK